MDWEDLEPKKKKPAPKNLEIMGIEELEEYISDLRSEIKRAEDMITSKKSQKNLAEGFFKS